MTSVTLLLGTQRAPRYFRQIVGSRQAALETLIVLRQVVSKARFSNFEQLVTIIRSVGRRLVEAQPKGVILSRCIPIRTLQNDGQNTLLVTLYAKSCIISGKNTTLPQKALRLAQIAMHSQSLNLCFLVNLGNKQLSQNQTRRKGR